MSGGSQQEETQRGAVPLGDRRRGASRYGIGLAAFSVLTFAALVLALGPAAASSGTPMQPSGTLQFTLTITQKWRLSRQYCPPGTPESTNCLHSVGEAAAAGLGRVRITYDKMLPSGDPNCFMIQNNTVLVEVAGKGTLELSRPGRVCASGPPPRVDGPYEFSVGTGSGSYAEATGMLVYRSAVGPGNPSCSCGWAKDTWVGTLTMPGVDFDITPPVLTGAVARTVRAPRGAKRVRVRYVVKAKDAVDGSVPAVCTPRSGSYFKIGRTAVACAASDSSSNTRRARFTITVKG